MRILSFLLATSLFSSTALIPLNLNTSAYAQEQHTPLRVVILPFENLTQKSEDQWLSNSFAESLTMGLLQVKALEVIERSQIKQIMKEQSFSQTDLVDPSSAPKLGKLMGAQIVVIGSYQKVGQQLQANVRLVDTETGQIDPQRFARINGNFEQIFDLQEDLAQKLIQNLNVQAQPQELKDMQTLLKATQSPEAYRFYQEGVELLRSGSTTKLEPAAQAFHQALNIDPNYVLPYAGLTEVHSRKAQRYMKMMVLPGKEKNYINDEQEARKYANKALSINSELPEVLRALAMLDWETDHRERALNRIKKAIEINPRDVDSLLAYLQFRLGEEGFKLEYQTITNELKALGANPDNPWLQFMLATLSLPSAIQQGQDMTLQVNLLQQAQKKLPRNPKIPFVLSTLLNYQGNREQALLEMQTAEDLSADFPELLASIAQIRSLLFQQHEAALKLSEKAIALAPNLIMSQQTRAEILYKMGRKDEANRIYEQLLKTSPENLLVMLSQSNSLTNSGDFSAANVILKKALQLVQEQGDKDLRPAVAFSLATTHVLLKEFDQALPLLLEVKEEPLFMLMTYMLLAQVYDALKDYSAALETFSTLLSISPTMRENPDMQNTYYKYYLLVAHQKEPQNAKILNDLGQKLLILQEYSDALDYLNKALALEPDNPVVNGNLGYLHLQINNLPEARAFLQRAVELNPGYAKAWYNLGLVRQQMGNRDNARSAFERVLTIEPDNEKALEALKQL